MKKKKAPRKTKSVRKVSKVKKIAKKIQKPKNLGKVTHYFDKINVAAIKLSQPLKVGDYIEFKHGGISFNQIVESMQIEHKSVTSAKKNAEIGMKVAQKVKEGWELFKAKQPPLLESKPVPKPMPAPTPAPSYKKEGYGGVKFMKF